MPVCVSILNNVLQGGGDVSAAANLTRVLLDQLDIFSELCVLPSRDQELTFGAGKVNDSYLNRAAGGNMSKLLHRLDRLFVDKLPFMRALHDALMQRPGSIVWPELLRNMRVHLTRKDRSVKEFNNHAEPHYSEPRKVALVRVPQLGFFEPLCSLTRLGVAFMPLWLKRGQQAAADTRERRDAECDAAWGGVLDAVRAAARVKGISVQATVDTNTLARHQDGREVYPAFLKNSTHFANSVTSLWHTENSHLTDYVQKTCVPVRCLLLALSNRTALSLAPNVPLLRRRRCSQRCMESAARHDTRDTVQVTYLRDGAPVTVEEDEMRAALALDRVNGPAIPGTLKHHPRMAADFALPDAAILRRPENEGPKDSGDIVAHMREIVLATCQLPSKVAPLRKTGLDLTADVLAKVQGLEAAADSHAQVTHFVAALVRGLESDATHLHGWDDITQAHRHHLLLLSRQRCEGDEDDVPQPGRVTVDMPDLPEPNLAGAIAQGVLRVVVPRDHTSGGRTRGRALRVARRQGRTHRRARARRAHAQSARQTQAQQEGRARRRPPAGTARRARTGRRRGGGGGGGGTAGARAGAAGIARCRGRLRQPVPPRRYRRAGGRGRDGRDCRERGARHADGRAHRAAGHSGGRGRARAPMQARLGARPRKQALGCQPRARQALQTLRVAVDA